MPGNVRPVVDERDGLSAYLAQQRYVLRTTAFGLTDAEAASSPSVSALCVGGLLKHCALVERVWMDTVRQQPSSASQEEYGQAFTMQPGETLERILADYEAAARDTDQILAGLDLDTPVPVPKGVPWFPQDIDAWSVRWVMLHLIQETARHAGHADIVRESIDGATGFPLMAAAEGQPETEWLKPWRRAD